MSEKVTIKIVPPKGKTEPIIHKCKYGVVVCDVIVSKVKKSPRKN